MDINHILTIFGAPTDAKDLILALATGMRDLREQNRALARELDAAKMALESMANAHDLLLEDMNPCVIEGLRVERDTALEHLAALKGAVKRQAMAAPPEPGSSLDDLLRYAAATQTEVRVTLKAGAECHEGELVGVPVWDSHGAFDDQPWQVEGWYCGTSRTEPSERITAVELL